MSEAWQAQAESIARVMVRPLEQDGGRYTFASGGGKHLVVTAFTGDCADCVMEDDDLARLLQEAIHRVDPDVTVSVVPG